MWERMATTRRQDRALHGAAKVVNLIIGLVALPAWLIAQRISGPLRRYLARRGEVRTPLPVPEPRERTMDALMRDLRAFPNRLRPVESAQLRKALPDLSSFVLSQHRQTAVLGYAYPNQFVGHRIRSADGEPIAISAAVHKGIPRPGLVVVHGLFSTSTFDYVRQIAVEAYFDWGFNVAVLDLRSFGFTEILTEAPNTGGWKEGEDILATAKFLRELGTTSVGTLGISLGATGVLGAPHLDQADQVLDGGVLAVSPPADVRRVAARLTKPVPRNHPRYPIVFGFRTMFTSRIRGGRWPADVDRLDQFLEEIAAPWYGVTPEELWRRSSPVNTIAGAKVPTLIMHPEDDYVIKVENAHMLAEAAAGNGHVRVWTLPGGGHGALDVIDRKWTNTVYRTFFERWADYPVRPEAEMVYSAQQDGKVKVDG
jgi:predicted alpha/beta-fold hydrolase